MSHEQERYKEYILGLITKLKNGEANDEDNIAIDYWYDNPVSEAKYTDGMSPSERLTARDRIFQNIDSQINKKPLTRYKFLSSELIRNISIAAILLAVMGGGLFYLFPGKTQPALQSNVVTHFVKPGSSKAVLTLANGKQIVLGDAEQGVLATQGNTVISKTGNGNIVYNTGASQKNRSDYNTMSTARGGEYRLTLSDGTSVWLNAASSIKYPTSFSGRERTVEVTGEAYFEVAHNKQKPFRVVSKGQVVEVLGTHFNVNAYANEPKIKTTLLQGSVKITTNGEGKVLKPGQQASVNENGIALAEVDVQEAIAWKDGFFEFTDADITSIMRQISRWYDVDVVFEGKIPKETFTGRVSKFLDIHQVMALVQSPDIHINYKGRRIMIKE